MDIEDIEDIEDMEEIEELIHCNFCESLYNQTRKPIDLRCRHTYCSKCVLFFVIGSEECPYCNGLININNLPINDTILQLANTYGKESKSIVKKETIKWTEEEREIITACCKISKGWICDLCVKNHSHQDPNADLNDCIMSIELAFKSIKKRINRSNREKFQKSAQIINEIGTFFDLQKILLERSEIQDEKSMKSKKMINTLSRKLKNIKALKIWLYAEEEIMEIDRLIVINLEYMELNELNDETLDDYSK